MEVVVATHGISASSNVSKSATSDTATLSRKFCRIKVSAIAHDNSGLFHLVHALRYRRGGEPHDAAEFGERDARILLNLAENLPADII